MRRPKSLRALFVPIRIQTSMTTNLVFPSDPHRRWHLAKTNGDRRPGGAAVGRASISSQPKLMLSGTTVRLVKPCDGSLPRPIAVGSRRPLAKFGSHGCIARVQPLFRMAFSNDHPLVVNRRSLLVSPTHPAALQPVLTRVSRG